MQAIFVMFLKMLVCSGIFFGYYWIFLRNKRFHQYNRYYLLATVLLSLVIPFISVPVGLIDANNISRVMYQTFQAIRVYDGDEVVVSEVSPQVLFLQYGLFILYVGGVVQGIILLMKSICIIRKLSLKYVAEKMDDIFIYHTNEPGTPFSFFRKIFWNDTINLHSREGQQIFKHEIFHIRQHHSVDIMFMNVVQLIVWFNPFYYFIRNELHTIHEFLADQHSIGENGHLEYAEILLEQSIHARQFQFSHHFFQHQIKRRIAMITQIQFKKPGYFSRLLALPLGIILVLFIMACAREQEPLENTVAAKQDKREIMDSGRKEARDAVPVEKESAIFTKVEIEPEFPGGQGAWQQFLNQNLKYPKDALDKEISGTVLVQFIVDTDGQLSDFKVLKDPGGGLGDEAIRMLKTSIKWSPAIQDGKKVKAFRKQPITFRLERIF